MVVGVPLRMNDDDAEVDGESLKGDVVVLQRNLASDEFVPVPKSVCASRVKNGNSLVSPRGVQDVV